MSFAHVRRVSAALFALCILPVLSLRGQTCMPQPFGLKHHWKADGSPADSAGHFDATLVGDATYIPGVVNQAFRFSGAGKASVADDPTLTLDDAFTMMGWVRLDQYMQRHPIASHDEGGGTTKKWILWYDEIGHGGAPFGPALRLHVNQPGAGAHDPIYAWWQPQYGRFYHLAVTRNGSQYRVYIDGALVNASMSSYPTPDPAAPLELGSAEGVFGRNTIDDFQIYDRALSAAEISGAFAAGASGFCPPKPCPSLTGGANYPAQNGSISVIAADFNGDGILDLATTNLYSNSVSVFLGAGNGAFAAAASFPVGVSPWSVAAADLNSDGKLDLAVTNTGGDNLSLLIGNGLGSFVTSSVITSGGGGPIHVASADLNHDGHDDLVVTNQTSHAIGVLLGNGDGTFRAAVSYGTGATPHSLTVADFTGDGELDLAIPNYGSGSVTVWVGRGDGTFANRRDYGAGAGAHSVAVADFDSDGRADLAVCNHWPNDVRIFHGNGDGSFVDRGTFAAGSRPVAITAGDFNGDGRSDLVVANRDSQDVSLLLGNGNATFAPAIAIPVGAAPYDVTAPDLDGDGRLDAAVALWGGNSVRVLLNEGTCNRVPLASAAPVSVSSGGTVRRTLATVSDLEDGADSLTVSIVGNSAPVSITNLTNAAGVISADLAVPCDALSGSHMLTLRVADRAGAAAVVDVPLLVQGGGGPSSGAIVASGPTTFCSGGSVTLTASPGASWLWSNGATTQSIVVEQSGNYSVVVTNGSGCAAPSSPVAVSVQPLPATPSISTTSSNGQATLTATALSGVSYSWTLDGAPFATGNPITTQRAGTYLVTVTTPSGCASSSAPTAVSITNGNQASSTLNGVVISTTSFPPGTLLSVDVTQDPAAIPPAPSGYYSLSDAAGNLLFAYDIKASQSATKKIEITFAVPASLAPDLKTLRSFRVLHGELDRSGNLVLVDRTLRYEFSNSPVVRRVVASVSSLSPFVLTYLKAPTIDAIVAPAQPVAVGVAINVSATFSDPTAGTGSADRFAAEWNWGDGVASVGTVTAPAGDAFGNVTAAHVYAIPGVYTVTLRLSDGTAEGGVSEASYQYIVAYDAAGGFVTGGGWIESPAGALRSNAALTGRATFGFVSRYKKGATMPDGQTEFDFTVGGFRFRSTSYDWLVVAGAKAQYKGAGSVNGVNGYRFLLTATDGDIAGGGGVDRFRIKVWEIATGAIVYDNVLDGDATDDLEGAKPQAIGGGSIVVHR